jgi:regulator of nonsense transcripts 2
MEENDFKDSQRRVSQMKFIAECYNFRVLHTDSLFNLLYSLINWDLEGNCEVARLKDLDEPGDCFRIRLVCTLLESLGRFFMHKRRRLLMDRFLIFF